MAGIKKETVQFLKDLKKHNDRDWFNKNKKRYEDAAADWLNLVGAFIEGLSSFDKALAKAKLQPKECVFRIYRDVRFSKDKSPYKTNFAAKFMTDRGNWAAPGYYIHFSPDESFLAGGAHMCEPKELQALREEISLNAGAFKKIIGDKTFKQNFKIEGEKLANVPRGFDKADPMAEYLKHKEMIIMHHFDEKDILSPKFSDYSIKIYKTMVPFNDFVRKPILNP
jgi:uncharacterized protein (TIGR02453 family)